MLRSDKCTYLTASINRLIITYRSLLIDQRSAIIAHHPGYKFTSIGFTFFSSHHSSTALMTAKLFRFNFRFFLLQLTPLFHIDPYSDSTFGWLKLRKLQISVTPSYTVCLSNDRQIGTSFQ